MGDEPTCDEAIKQIIDGAVRPCCGCDRAEEVIDALREAGYRIVEAGEVCG